MLINLDPAVAGRAEPRRPDRPARHPAGRARPVRRGGPAARVRPRRRRVRFDRRVPERRPGARTTPRTTRRRRRSEVPAQAVRAGRGHSGDDERPRREEAAADEPAAADSRPNGPWDIDETDFDEDDSQQARPRQPGGHAPARARPAAPGRRAERPGGRRRACRPEQGAVELRAVRRPAQRRHLGRRARQIAAEVTRRGGTASEHEGHWGPELRVVCQRDHPGRPHRPAALAGLRHRRARAGCCAPRCSDSRRSSRQDDGVVESALRDVIVRRGSAPHAPGEALPAHRPARPRRADAAARRPESGTPAPRRAGADYTGDMTEVTSRLRRSLSRWANGEEQEAEELQKDVAKAGCCPIMEAADRAARGHPGQPPHRHPAAPRRRPRPGGRALRRVGHHHGRLAGPPSDRRHRARPPDPGAGTHRHCRTPRRVMFNPRYELR